MGRTNPTFRDILSSVEDRWQEFRRTLRHRDKPRFDRIFEYARNHADAAGHLNHENRLAPIFVSIDLEQERRIDELEERVAELEADTDSDEHDGPDD